MRIPTFARNEEDAVGAGVCAGIARTLGVDATLVRLVFALLALAGGAGILLYLALWAYSGARSPWVAGALAVFSAALVLGAVGIPNRVGGGVLLVALGLVLIWRRGGRLQVGEPLSLVGLMLVVGGAVIVLARGGVHTRLVTPGAVAGSLLLVAGPWLWRLALDRDAERAARVRTEERAEMAARVHDSVLQTLALIQKHAEEPRRVASFARRQERELRGWLYGDAAAGETLVALLGSAATEVEELHGVLVELASSGDSPADDRVRALALAAREAMTNSAKYSGAGEVDVFAEATPERVAVYVRDRGNGFDPAAVPPGRRGIAESIVGRMTRAGGTATVTSAPGEGTEVELTLPRSGS